MFERLAPICGTALAELGDVALLVEMCQNFINEICKTDFFLN